MKKVCYKEDGDYEVKSAIDVTMVNLAAQMVVSNLQSDKTNYYAQMLQLASKYGTGVFSLLVISLLKHIELPDRKDTALRLVDLQNKVDSVRLPKPRTKELKSLMRIDEAVRNILLWHKLKDDDEGFVYSDCDKCNDPSPDNEIAEYIMFWLRRHHNLYRRVIVSV